jgi:hypothetical protein
MIVPMAVNTERRIQAFAASHWMKLQGTQPHR